MRGLEGEVCGGAVGGFAHDEVEEEADDDPGGAEELGVEVEVEPDEGADDDAAKRREEGEGDFFLRAEFVVEEGGGVDADEGDEGSEVEELGALLEAHEEGAEEGDGSEEEDVDAEEREDEEMATEAKKVWRRMMIMAVGRKKPKAKDCGDGDYNCACSGKNPMDLVPADTNCGQKLNEGKELLALLKRNNECRTRNQSRERVIVLRKVKWVVCGHRMEVRSEGVQRVQGRV